MDVSMTAAFVAGLLSFMSPCVLPIVPPYLCFLAGVSVKEFSEAADRATTLRILRTACFFVLGFSSVFVMLGATASFLGQAVSEHLETLSVIAGGMIIIMGLHFLGLFRIGLLFREARFNAPTAPTGPLGAYVMGLAFAFGWTPCVGPVLATILFVAGAEETVWQGALLLFVYALGIGLPFILAAAFARPFMAWLARFKGIMGYVEKVMGGFLVLTGVLFVTGLINEMGFWLLELFPALGRFG